MGRKSHCQTILEYYYLLLEKTIIKCTKEPVFVILTLFDHGFGVNNKPGFLGKDDVTESSTSGDRNFCCFVCSPICLTILDVSPRRTMTSIDSSMETGSVSEDRPEVKRVRTSPSMLLTCCFRVPETKGGKRSPSLFLVRGRWGK